MSVASPIWPFSLRCAERALHAEHRGLQRGVGVEHAGEAELLQLVVRQRSGVLPPITMLTSCGHGSLAIAVDLLVVRRRLDEADVGAGLAEGVRAVHRGGEAFDGDGVGARDDQQIGIGARVHRGLDLCDHLGGRDDLLALEMAAALREHLVLDLDRVGAGALQHLDRCAAC